LKPDFLGKEDILAAEQMVMSTLQKMALGGIHGMPIDLTTDDRSYRSRIREI